MKKAILYLAAFGALALGVAGDAAAQEATVLFSTPNPDVVSITADGHLIYKGTESGTMTATIIAVEGTVTGGNFTPAGAAATGRAYITVRGLDYCSITRGCFGAFGLNDAGTTATIRARLATLIAMDLRTVTMFAASGANLNEQVGGNRADNFLLFHLAIANRPQHVAAFVRAGASVNALDSEQNTPLHYAASRGSRAAITILASEGASVNAAGDNGRTPLHFAARGVFGYAAVTAMSVLLAEGASVNAADDAGDAPLHYVASDGNAIRALLAGGASVNLANNAGNAPLHLASRSGSFGSIRPLTILLTAGASVNAKNNAGRTPLHFAASLNALGAASVLLISSASVNAKDNAGLTPLHLAAIYNASSDGIGTVTVTTAAGILSILLDESANVNAAANNGDTPLDLAIGEDVTTAISLLIENGGVCGTSTDSRCPSGLVLSFPVSPNVDFIKRSGVNPTASIGKLRVVRKSDGAILIALQGLFVRDNSAESGNGKQIRVVGTEEDSAPAAVGTSGNAAPAVAALVAGGGIFVIPLFDNKKKTR